MKGGTRFAAIPVIMPAAATASDQVREGGEAGISSSPSPARRDAAKDAVNHLNFSLALRRP
jgi:hypothetical protein